MAEKEDKVKDMTNPDGIQGQAATMIRTLWANGVIVSHPEEMLHTDGLHRLAVKPHVSDEKAAQVFKQIAPDLLLLLQGILPKDAKVNS